MTLIIGIKCSDGIVMAADGAATFGGALGQTTIRQSTTKLDIVSESAIIGVSGPVGLGQLLRAEVLSFCQSSNPKAKPVSQAMQLLRDSFWRQIGPTLEHAKVTGQLIGQPAFNDALSRTLVAIVLKEGPALIQFSEQAAPEAASESLPFMAIGSGQPIADPFLAFIRRIFWTTGLPDLQEGVFSAVWALEHAIQTNPGGVADPKQIVVLEQIVLQKGQAAQWKPRALDDNDIQQHMERIADHEQALRACHRLVPDSSEVVESVPVPAPAAS